MARLMNEDREPRVISHWSLADGDIAVLIKRSRIRVDGVSAACSTSNRLRAMLDALL